MRHNTRTRTTPHWDGQNKVLETDGAVIKGRYLRGANLICQVIDLSLAFYLFSAHGDVVQRVDTAGKTLAKYDYDAFGNRRREPDAGTRVLDGSEETDPNPFRYCGEYYQIETKDYYLRARTYNPRNGRFTSNDPARSGPNWYTYCENTPVRKVDPSGLKSIWEILGGIIGGIIGSFIGSIKGGIIGSIAGGIKGANAGAAFGAATGTTAATVIPPIIAEQTRIQTAQANGAIPVPQAAISSPAFNNMLFKEDNRFEVPHGRYGLTRNWDESSKAYTKTHNGIDVSTLGDKTIHSPVSGEVYMVVSEDPNSNVGVGQWGAYIVIKDDDGYDHIFAHCESKSFQGLKKDDHVTTGQPVAIMGMAGNANTDKYYTGQGPHVHYEVRTDYHTPGSHVDPTHWVGMPNDSGTPDIGGMVGSWYVH